MKGWGRSETTEQTRRPTPSSATTPTCASPGVTAPGIEPGSLPPPPLITLLSYCNITASRWWRPLNKNCDTLRLVGFVLWLHKTTDHTSSCGVTYTTPSLDSAASSRRRYYGVIDHFTVTRPIEERNLFAVLQEDRKQIPPAVNQRRSKTDNKPQFQKISGKRRGGGDKWHSGIILDGTSRSTSSLLLGVRSSSFVVDPPQNDPGCTAAHQLTLESSMRWDFLPPGISSLQSCISEQLLGKPGSIPSERAPGFSLMVIVPEDAAGQRVFPGVSRFPRTCIPALLHTHLAYSHRLSRPLCYKPPMSLHSRTCKLYAKAPASGPRHMARVEIGDGTTVYTMKFRKSAQLSPRRTGFDSRRVPDYAAGRRVFWVISRFPPPCHSGAAMYSPRFNLVGSQDPEVRSRPNLVHATPLFSARQLLVRSPVGRIEKRVYLAFESERWGSHKDDNATRDKCAIAPKRKALTWRAEFSSHCMYMPLTIKNPEKSIPPNLRTGTAAPGRLTTDGTAIHRVVQQGGEGDD
ncbi:hypothetical protein PR048_022721 [Dryococelus australis]|uniref:Uncharacterized protein n=1 Tax=Dryococelus australis TaxID=614101 RepID=A0ABQ9GS15_9NEOP|nr:hypothetical protein PR048_022721 [Dryococelus australis]